MSVLMPVRSGYPSGDCDGFIPCPLCRRDYVTVVGCSQNKNGVSVRFVCQRCDKPFAWDFMTVNHGDNGDTEGDFGALVCAGVRTHD